MTTLAFIDLETTGLDPGWHHIWEFGAVVRGHRDPGFNGEWRVELRPNLSKADPQALRVGRYYERRTLRTQQDQAHVHTRPPWTKLAGADGPRWYESSFVGLARTLAVMLDGAIIIGSNPGFDTSFLARYLRDHGQAPTWHYHPRDIGDLALGYLAGARDGYNRAAAWMSDAHAHIPVHAQGVRCQLPALELDEQALPEAPWKTDDLSRRLGVDPPGPDERHTALGDAWWAARVFDHIMGQPEVPGGRR